MATASTRTVWKGAISFGLVHIPVALYTATAETRPRFKLIDKSSMSPVGNQQVNKTTGEDVQRDELVKGIEIEDGQFFKNGSSSANWCCQQFAGMDI